jgi:hypothetical protein
LAVSRVDRTLQIVDDDQKLTREVCNRELALVSRYPTGLPSRVLRVGQCPQQAIPQRRVLLQQSADVDSLGCNGFVFDTVRPSHARPASCCLAQGCCR